MAGESETRRKRKWFAGLGIGSGVVITTADKIWTAIQHAQTAEGIVEDRTVILRILLADWFGPTLAVGSLVVFLLLLYRERPKPQPRTPGKPFRFFSRREEPQTGAPDWLVVEVLDSNARFGQHTELPHEDVDKLPTDYRPFLKHLEIKLRIVNRQASNRASLSFALGDVSGVSLSPLQGSMLPVFGMPMFPWEKVFDQPVELEPQKELVGILYFASDLSKSVPATRLTMTDSISALSWSIALPQAALDAIEAKWRLTKYTVSEVRTRTRHAAIESGSLASKRARSRRVNVHSNGRARAS